MNRLIIVANRLPVTAIKKTTGFNLRPSPGGLATGLSSLRQSHSLSWIGWPGVKTEKLNSEDRTELIRELAKQNLHPVFLTDRQIKNYYHGFANKTIWPLFHYFPLHAVYEDRFWNAYEQVNKLFCDKLLEIVEPKDKIWVHDYQLMLLPRLLREKLPDVQIGFFLHIPFPSFELFRLLPWREKLLRGLLDADLIGFHTYDYVRHFLSSACRILGLEQTLGRVKIDNRIVKVDAFPLGIDYERYSQAPDDPAVQKEAEKIRQKVGSGKIIISIDRLDYTKGIIQRLEAFDLFLSENPQYKGKVTLIIVAVPSRADVTDYKELRKDLEQLVGRVNGEHGSIGWMPVWYLYRYMPFKVITALYHVADVALVTPLRDGMNLIAKEFVAAKKDGKGMLILSEMAGAASELGEALIVNANNKGAIVQAIKQALEMPESEQIEYNRLMQTRLSRYNVSRWAEDFLHALLEVKESQALLSVSKLTAQTRQNLIADYHKSKHRFFLLDYDGTLVGYHALPDKARPDEKIILLLERLSKQPNNSVVIISGRDKNTLTQWFGSLDVTMVAEHGAWIKPKQRQWQHAESSRAEWKDSIKPILELYADRTPGALVEEKDFSLVWHYRRADRELAYVRSRELIDALLNLTAGLDVGVYEGNKIIEVKYHSANKGRAAEACLNRQKWDFLLAAGDDYTDEEMFGVLPEQAYTIKVGFGMSAAKFNVDTVQDLRLLLEELVGDKDVES